MQAYLNRNEAFDQRGPRLNALITLNSNAIREAEALDLERSAKGPRGPLHGIPVIVKDNYSTADMQTTAGTLALLGFVPASDAFQVRKLREAGAEIIGNPTCMSLRPGLRRSAPLLDKRTIHTIRRAIRAVRAAAPPQQSRPASPRPAWDPTLADRFVFHPR